MKKLRTITSIIIGLMLGFSAVSNAQIIDSLPYFKQKLILDKLVNPFLQGLIYNEGVPALKDFIDPKFKPPVKGWIRDSMFNHIRNTLAGIEFQDGDDLFLLSDCEFVGIGGKVLELDPELIIITLSAPEITNPAIMKGPYDPLRAYDLNPNDLSILSDDFLFPKGIKNKKDLTHSLSLLLKKQQNGNYKIYPDGDLSIVLGESDMRSYGLLTDDGTLVLFVEKFLKSIRENDKKAFRSAFDEDLVRSDVWTDMRPFSKYKKMPEYSLHNPRSGNIVILELEDDLMSPQQLITWGGDVATFAAVYRLPEGKKASNPRAPSDILGLLLYDEEIHIIDALIGKGNDPNDFITIVITKEKGANNFNIGMPPSVR